MTAERPPVIDPRILEAFNLTGESVSRIISAGIEEILFDRAAAACYDMFIRKTDATYTDRVNILLPEDFKGQHITSTLRGLISPTITIPNHLHRIQDLPDVLMKAVTPTGTPETSWSLSALINATTARSFLKALGLQALRQNDLETAINAFDAASPTGLLDNQDLLKTINKKTNPDTRTLMAHHLQQRIDHLQAKTPASIES